MKNIFKSYLIFLAGALLFNSGCKKFVQIPLPKNQLTASTVFADSTDAAAAITGIYINMMQNYGLTTGSGAITLYTGLTGDELYQSANDMDLNEFYNNAINPKNSYNSLAWVEAYQYIYDANACIEGVKRSNSISATGKNVLIAEASVIRAFYYFNLVNLYGPVPLVTTTDYNINRSIPRSATNAVYDQIIADLKFAQNNLPKNITTNTRANYYAATALLAKVYLYRQQYASAVTESDKVINSGNYALVTNLNEAFLSGSSETIFAIAPVVPGRATWEGYTFVPTDPTTIPAFVVSDDLYSSFEKGDLRKTDWIGADTVSGKIYPYPYKYKTGVANGASTENYVIFRLAEQYLIEAEAKANSGDQNGALAALNIIRRRAGLPDDHIFDKASLLLAIERERRSELFCEWGNRWFDLNRTNRAATVLGAEKSNWKLYSALFPVPFIELTSNPKLDQNQGY